MIVFQHLYLFVFAFLPNFKMGLLSLISNGNVWLQLTNAPICQVFVIIGYRKCIRNIQHWHFWCVFEQEKHILLLLSLSHQAKESALLISTFSETANCFSKSIYSVKSEENIIPKNISLNTEPLSDCMHYKLSSIWTYWGFWIGNKIYQDIELALTHFGNQLLVSDHLDDCEQLYW